MELIITDKNKENIKRIKLDSFDMDLIRIEIIKFSKDNHNITLFDFNITGECVIKTEVQNRQGLGALFG